MTDTLIVHVGNWPSDPSSWSIVGTVVAVAVAVLSLFVSIYFTCLQRKHMRRSAKAKVSLEYDETDPREIGVRIENSGIGPAELKRIEYSWKEEKHVNPSGHALQGFFRKVFSDIPNIEIFRWSFQPGQYLPVGKLRWLYHVKPHVDNCKDMDRDALKKRITCVSITLEYESVYKERDSVYFPMSREEWERLS